MACNRIEMRIVEPAIHKVGMPTAHIKARVVVRPAESEGKKRLLLCSLALHVNIVKEIRDGVVGKYSPIKVVDSCVYGRFAAKGFVKRRRHSQFTFLCTASAQWVLVGI